MKKILALVLVFASALLACGFSGDQDNRRREIARKLYGRIYITDCAATADFRVRVVDNIAVADLRVFVAPRAYGVGQWEFVKERSLSNFSIYYVPVHVLSDVSVLFVNSRGLAGPL